MAPQNTVRHCQQLCTSIKEKTLNLVTRLFVLWDHEPSFHSWIYASFQVVSVRPVDWEFLLRKRGRSHGHSAGVGGSRSRPKAPGQTSSFRGSSPRWSLPR